MEKTSAPEITAPATYNPVGGPNIKRLLVRDLSGDECCDWIADIWPERPTAVGSGLPVQLARRWKLFEAVKSVEALSAQHAIGIHEAFQRWSDEQVRALSTRDGPPVELCALDDLHYDVEKRVWWRSEDTDRFWRVYCSLKQEGTEHSLAALDSPTGTRYLKDLGPKPEKSGMILEAGTGAASRGLIAQMKIDEPPPKGFWNVQHALLTVGEFISVLQVTKGTAEVARRIVQQTNRDFDPICHTLLVRPHLEWVPPLLRTQLPVDEIISGVKRLRAVMLEAGIRPVTQNRPPLVSEITPLQTISDLLGSTFIKPAKVQLLAAAGVDSLDALLAIPPYALTGKSPMMPSDITAIASSLKALGYSYQFNESDMISMKRMITYTTNDGRVFEKRDAARAHHLETLRRQRVSECLLRLLNASDEKANTSIGAVVDAICNQAGEVADALSSRAAVRAEMKKTSQKS